MLPLDEFRHTVATTTRGTARRVSPTVSTTSVSSHLG
jgi:hypothetical protein